MSGPYVRPLSAQIVLSCDARGCREQWASESFSPSKEHWPYAEPIRPALNLGWRVYAGKRTQFTYCPEHMPTAPMRLAHGIPDWVDAVTWGGAS